MQLTQCQALFRFQRSRACCMMLTASASCINAVRGSTQMAKVEKSCSEERTQETAPLSANDALQRVIQAPHLSAKHTVTYSPCSSCAKGSNALAFESCLLNVSEFPIPVTPHSKQTHNTAKRSSTKLCQSARLPFSTSFCAHTYGESAALSSPAASAAQSPRFGTVPSLLYQYCSPPSGSA